MLVALSCLASVSSSVDGRVGDGRGMRTRQERAEHFARHPFRVGAVMAMAVSSAFFLVAELAFGWHQPAWVAAGSVIAGSTLVAVLGVLNRREVRRLRRTAE